MKYLAILGLLATLVVGSTGCSMMQKCGLCDGGCDACGSGACMDGACANGACWGNGNGYGDDGCYGDGSGRRGRRNNGLTSGTVAYPYYTTHGPRDYFACNPGYPRN